MNASSREHPEALLPWYVNGTLEGAERQQVQDHLSYCLTCRREVQRLQALRQDVRNADALEDSKGARPGEAGLERLLAAIDGEEVPAARRFNVRSWLPLAAAAVLLLAIAFAIQRPVDVPPVIERGEETAAPLRSALEEGVKMPRSNFELRWEAADDWQEARFSLRVTTTDLQLITEVQDLEETRYRVPPEALDGLPTPSPLLWQVEAVRPNGQRVRSSTFLIEVQ